MNCVPSHGITTSAAARVAAASLWIWLLAGEPGFGGSPPALPPLPDPSLSGLPSAAQAELQEVRRSILRLVSEPPAAATPELAQLYGRLGMLYLAYDLPEAAAVCHGYAAELAPNEHRWPYYLGAAQRAAGRPERAVESFRRAAEIAADAVPAWIQLGELESNAARAAAAEGWFRQAIAEKPDSAVALVGLAQILLARNDYSAALSVLEQARRSDPGATEIDWLLSLAHRGLRDPEREDEAGRRGGVLPPRIVDPLLDEVWGLTRGTGFYEDRAARHYAAGRHARALTDARRAVAASPDAAGPQVAMGRILLVLADPRGARAALERSLELDPGNLAAREELAGALSSLGEDEEAARQLDQVLSADPGRLEAHLRRAEALRRLGRYDESIGHYRRGEGNPHDGAAHLGEALALIRLHRYREARDRLEAGLEKLPESRELRGALARVLASAPDDDVRDGALALKLMTPKRDEKVRPEHAVAWAMAAAETGDFRTAGQLQRRVIDWRSRTDSVEALSALREDLAGYEAGRPCRRPWPDDDPVLSPPALTPQARPKSMVQVLQRLPVDVDPAVDVYANAQRVDWLAGKIAGEQDPTQRNVHRLERAQELLQSGRTKEATAAVQELIRDYEALGTPADSENMMNLRAFLALTHLRRGEQDNCIAHHTIESCLMPIQGAGVHKIEDGSRAAAALYTQLLELDPENLRYRWLLNLAHMTLGEYPHTVDERWLVPPEVFASDHDPGRFSDVAPALGLDIDTLAGGVIMEDFDGDGFLDLMFSALGLRNQLRFFHNNGDGTFSDWTERAGLLGQWGGLNINHADYDNDGRADVLVLRGGWLPWGNYPVSLLHNDGDGRFSDVTLQSGLFRYRPSQTAGWADFNRDGWLDLFIGNESFPGISNPSELYVNNGDGTFREAADEVGLHVEAWVKAVAWGDYDNDGLPDLFLSCYDRDKMLFHNEGSRDGRWRFTEVTAAAGVAGPRLSFPTWFWDYDNDGWEDILVASLPNYLGDALDLIVADYLGKYEGEHSAVYHNNGDGTFTDRSEELGLDAPLVAMGANFGDLDNDGFLDCYFGTGQPRMHTLVPNRMYRNAGGRKFQDVTTAGGFGHIQKGHGIAFGDLDNDGDQDIYAVLGGAYTGDSYRNSLFLNPGNSNHWITLRLEGVTANRAALGARIRITTLTDEGERTIHTTVSTGGSFGASSLQQEIGLGTAKAIRSIEITWPTMPPLVQRIADVGMDRVLRIREGEAPVEVPVQRLDFEALRAPGAGTPQHHH